MDSQAKTPKLLDRVRQMVRLHHYSLHTEWTYVDWIKRCVRFHQMQRREDLDGGEEGAKPVSNFGTGKVRKNSRQNAEYPNQRRIECICPLRVRFSAHNSNSPGGGWHFLRVVRLRP